MKKAIGLTVVCIAFLLSGCSTKDNFETQLFENSKISENEEYQNYLELLNSNELDDNNYYVDIVDDKPVIIPENTVHITFSENSDITANYYSEAEFINEIDVNNCFLKTGESVFAKITVNKEDYCCTGFRILDIDEGGKRTLLFTLVPDDNNFLFEVTGEMIEKELSIVPIGDYIKNGNLTLPQPEYGGTIKYYAEGSEITSQTCSFNEGTEISMEFYPWQGWINNFKNGQTYIVTDPDNQTILFDGKSVDAVFTEDMAHMPELTVVLEKSLDKNMEFKFEGDGYEIEWNHKDHKIIDGLKIGTGKNISFYVGNKSIQTGTAIKLLIEKEGEDKSKGKTEKIKTNEIRLIDKLVDIQKPIEIYNNNGTSNIWYNSIKITASIVEVAKIERPTAENGITVLLHNSDDGRRLAEGELFEKAAKLTVIIKPDKDYYLTGKSIKDGVFKETMSFEKYLSEIDSIIEKHPAKKYITITLDGKDPFGCGKCEFKLNGNDVFGTVKAKDGDKLSLEYTITDESYVIEGKTQWFGKNDKKQTVELELDGSFDGKNLSIENFGIKVRKGE